MSAPVPTPAVPDALLVPLLDTAADVLRRLPAEEVPVALRALAGFERRGLTSATARHQLRRALDLDDAFRARVREAFVARPEVEAVLARWSAEGAIAAVHEAASRNDLALLASALYAARPAGAEFGLGAACNEDRHRREARTLEDDLRAQATLLESAEKARRRAEAAHDAARAEIERLERALRDARRARRDREDAANRRAEEAERRAREVEAARDRAERERELAEARARREAERARDAERRLRDARREPGEPAPSPPAPGPSPAALADLARRARELVAALDQVLDHPGRAGRVPRARTPPPGAASPAAPRAAPRATVPCPPGLRSDQPEGLEAMLRANGVVLVVDGYNVSMSGWPDASVERQRQLLLGALARLHLRTRAGVVVVFDGTGLEASALRTTPGVRVVFSPAGDPADAWVIREVAALPARVPVLVVSNDTWVREHAVVEGGHPVGVEVFLEVLRR